MACLTGYDPGINDVFTFWLSQGTSTSATTDTEWYAWNNSTTATSIQDVYYHWVTQVVESEEEKAKKLEARKQRELEAERKRIRAQRLDRIKKLRAKRLLVQQLDEDQKRMLMEKDCFYMRSEKGKLFKIKNGRSGNVYLMKDDKEDKIHQVLCAHPDAYCPNYDTMLAQKLMLETDEEQFLRTANVHRTYQ